MVAIASLNPQTAQGRLEFFEPPSDRLAREAGRSYRRFCQRYSGEAIKTRLTVPGEPERILYVGRATAIESVLAAGAATRK